MEVIISLSPDFSCEWKVRWWPQERVFVSAVRYGFCEEEPKTKAFSAGIWLSKTSFLLKILSDEQSCSCQSQKGNNMKQCNAMIIDQHRTAKTGSWERWK